MSSQTSHARWRLHVATVGDPVWHGRVITLAAGATLLGREPEGTGETVPIADRTMSRTHATLVVRGPGKRVELVDHNSSNGCWHDATRVDGTAWIADGTVLRMGGLVAVLESDGGLVPDGMGPNRLVPGGSAVARRIRDTIEMASGDDMPMLIVGEPDTGKRRAARLVHELAGRGGPLVMVDASQLQEDRFEAELFGYASGPAHPHGVQGRLREAHNGTLLIDNITKLAPLEQVKLLRVVEERMVHPIGGRQSIPVDVRVVALGVDDLRTRVQKRRFHAVLAAHLRTHEIHLPPLRQRAVDLFAWADALVPSPKDADSWADALDADAVEVMLLQPWEGNLDELEGVLHDAADELRAGKSSVDVLPAHYVAHVRELVAKAAEADPEEAFDPRISKVSRAESRPDAVVLRELMLRHRGNLGAVARELTAHRRQVYRWLDYAGVPRDYGSG